MALIACLGKCPCTYNCAKQLVREAWIITSGDRFHLCCAVVNVYVPNSGEGLKRLDYRVGSWDVAFADYLAGLSAKKPVILTGDLNCAHQEIDIHDPKRNLKSAGFTVVGGVPVTKPV